MTASCFARFAYFGLVSCDSSSESGEEEQEEKEEEKEEEEKEEEEKEKEEKKEEEVIGGIHLLSSDNFWRVLGMWGWLVVGLFQWLRYLDLGILVGVDGVVVEGYPPSPPSHHLSPTLSHNSRYETPSVSFFLAHHLLLSHTSSFYYY